MKRGVPLFITFFVGTLLILSVFIPPMETLGENFTLFFDIAYTSKNWPIKKLTGSIRWSLYLDSF